MLDRDPRFFHGASSSTRARGAATARPAWVENEPSVDRRIRPFGANCGRFSHLGNQMCVLSLRADLPTGCRRFLGSCAGMASTGDTHKHKIVHLLFRTVYSVLRTGDARLVVCDHEVIKNSVGALASLSGLRMRHGRSFCWAREHLSLPASLWPLKA